MIKSYTPNRSDRGSILVSAIIMIILISSIGFTIAALVAAEYKHTRYEAYSQNAQLTAEAGIEQSVEELNISSSFAGYNTPQVYFNNSTQGYGVFTTTVNENSNGKSKNIISVGQVYLSSSSTSPFVTRKTIVNVVGTASGGNSVLTGPGGLILGGNANLINTNVYVGGTIDMQGFSRIGTYNQPVTVDAAFNSCPDGPNPGTTYPQVCTSGQPITLSSNSAIYGSVCATGQTSTGPNNNIQPGNGGLGLEPGCTAPVSSPPYYDRLSQINAVAASGTIASGTDPSYVCGGSTTAPSWTPNLELTGNVSLASNCSVTVEGNAWITGNLSLSGDASMTSANALGTTVPIVMVDGTITINGSATMAANDSAAGIEFISFKSYEACTIATTSATYCPTLTGNDLYNSQTMQTINIGGQVSLAGMIFDSYWSEVSIAGGSNIGAAIGQTVNLDGSGSVIFGTTLASNTTTWSISSYEPYYGP